MLSLVLVVIAVAEDIASPATSLRGAERQLQTQARDSSETTTPQCRPGYVDITGGKAYFWSCGFYCEGGAYFTNSNCLCACLRPDQIERLPQNPPTGPVTPGTVPPRTARVTTPLPTMEPRGDRVSQFPTEGVDQRPPPVNTANEFKYVTQGGPAFQAPEAATGEEESITLLLVATIGGAIVVIAATITLACALWSSRSTRRQKHFMMTLEAPKFHAPVVTRPQPVYKAESGSPPRAVFLDPPSRVSWNSGNTSGSRTPEEQPVHPQRAQRVSGSQKGHLKLPEDADRMLKGSPSLSKTSTCSGAVSGTSGTSSISSQSSWAVKVARPARSSRGSNLSLSSHKTSRVHPGTSEHVFG